MDGGGGRKMKSQYSDAPTLQHSSTPPLRCSHLLCFLCVALWLFTGNPTAQAARVAGEEGITPAAPGAAQPAARPPARKPEAAKPPAKTPSPKKPVPVQEKVRPKKETPKEQPAPAKKAPEKRFVTIDFDNVNIALFIKFISELTGKNFVVDKAIRGKVTIISPTEISVKEAYKVFESVLEVHGYTTVPAGSIIKIVPAVQARSKAIETRLRKGAIHPEDRVVTQLIPLKYANPNELKKLFVPLISKSSVIVSYHPTGMLIVTDVLSNIKRVLRIIKAIDVVGIGAEISVVPLEYATASTLVKSLTSIFRAQARARKKGAPMGPVLKIVADERTNSLIIAASEDDALRVKQLIVLLDKEIPRGEGDIHVYYLQNANAEDLAKVLTALPSKQARAPAKGKAPVISKEVQIVADKATNSLIITANKDDYLVLEDVIKKLDIPRRMVYIEALIMEVSVSKDFELGVEWQAGEHIGSHDGREIGAFGVSAPGDVLLKVSSGFSLGVLGEEIKIGGIPFANIGAVVRAYQKDSDVHILSTPQILTTDNEEAEIYVGENVPYLTRLEKPAEGTITGTEYASYDYKDVGVRLKITPQINQERFVRLKISQEVIKLKKGADPFRPTTLKRTAETTVIVKDRNTVVIGGIIGEEIEKGTYKVPCLGNIPVFGWLFKSIYKDVDRTNLFIFLTPHIIEEPAEAKKIYEEKKGEMDTIQEGVIKMYKRGK